MSRRKSRVSSGGHRGAAADKVRLPRRRSQPYRTVALTLGLCLVAAVGAFIVFNSQRTRHQPLLPLDSSQRSSVQHTVSPKETLAERVNRANQFLSQGKLSEAVELLTEAQRENPEDEDVQYNLGIAHARMGNFDAAIQHYQEALRLFPDYAEAHNNLGNVHMRLGHTEEAIKQYQSAVKIMPEYASGWNNLGNALHHHGQPHEARQCYQKAVDLSPDYIEARHNLAVSFLHQQQFAHAQTEFEAVLRLDPNFGPAKAALNTLATRLKEEGSVAP
jgi:tetratricopeptide (TPR) repeat protein